MQETWILKRRVADHALSLPGNECGTCLVGSVWLPCCAGTQLGDTWGIGQFSARAGHRWKVHGIQHPWPWEEGEQNKADSSGEDELAVKGPQGMPSTEVVGQERGLSHPRETEGFKSNLSGRQVPGWPN